MAALDAVNVDLAEIRSRIDATRSIITSRQCAEAALTAEVAALSDPVMAHDRLHHYLLHHPPSTLGRDRDRVLQTAYPDFFWDEVMQATETYPWDPRVFHALVREESSFNPDNDW